VSTRRTFTALELSGARTLDIDIDAFVVAGWTGRDAEAVERHVRELERIGVQRPSAVPMFYRVSAGNLTHAPRIQVAGRASTGEAEFALIAADGELWVGVGSDHTDRDLEKHSVTLSKQVCAKPVAADLWRFADVAPHWDNLVLSSYAHIRGERRLYQRGSVAVVRKPGDLIEAYRAAVQLAVRDLPDGVAMFCGTLPVHGELEFADRFEIELHDPRMGRTLRHTYDIEPLPLVD
jgi:hypothetical protein